MAGDYGLIDESTLRPLGQIAINRVAFDPTKRHALVLSASKSFLHEGLGLWASHPQPRR